MRIPKRYLVVVIFVGFTIGLYYLLDWLFFLAAARNQDGTVPGKEYIKRKFFSSICYFAIILGSLIGGIYRYDERNVEMAQGFKYSLYLFLASIIFFSLRACF